MLPQTRPEIPVAEVVKTFGAHVKIETLDEFRYVQNYLLEFKTKIAVAEVVETFRTQPEDRNS